MARAYHYDTSAQALYRPAEAPGFFEDWAPQDSDRLDLLCAEMSRLAYAPPRTVEDSLGRAGYRLDTWLGGTTIADRIASRGTEGFVARSAAAGRTVVAFRGTESRKPEDLLSDLLTSTVEWTGRGRVHRGFARAFDAIRSALERAVDGDPTVLITGHSLGAGVATLAAAALDRKHPTLITFGSPRVGDAAFASSLAGVTFSRFVNCCDVVTRIPPDRFDAAQIETLLRDLTNQPVLSSGLATVVSSVLARVGFQPEFTHLGAVRYIDEAGVHRDRIRDSDITADQTRARTAYAARTSSGSSRRSIAGWLSAIAHPFNALRDTLVGALDQMTGDTVPLRDLSDHAPINYVSSFSGRRP